MHTVDLSIPAAYRQLASGRYEHQAQPHIQDRWQLYAAEGNQLLRVDYFHATMRMQALITLSAAGVQRVRYRIDGHPQAQKLDGDYQLLPDKLLVRRTLGAALLEEAIVHDGAVLLDVPFSAAKGYTLSTMPDGVRVSVFAPLFTQGDRAGDLAKKSARRIGPEAIPIAGRVIDAQRYEYGYDYWLDDDKMVLCARSTAHDYTIVLTEYERTNG